MKYQIINGNNIDVLKTFPDNHFDSIVTDPPYGIDFLGKSWDANTGALETYQECLRVLKPGGHILAFSAARTYHHLAITLEQAGFEIRDQIMWIYSSGFPKSQDVGKSIDRAEKKLDPNYGSIPRDKQASFVSTEGKGNKSSRCKKCLKDIVMQYSCKDTECAMVYNPQTDDGKKWHGWGTALKPAHEPIALARKPIRGSIKDNVLKHGVGALNIDATRVGVEADELESFQKNWDRDNAGMGEYQKLDGSVGHGADQLKDMKKDIREYVPQGRFPANVLGEIPDYQKYFYCPKVSRRERHIGFDDAPDAQFILNEMGAYFINDQGNKVAYEDRHNVGMVYVPYIDTTIPFRHIYDEYTKWKKSNNNTEVVGNNHPTVKPIELMKYLIKLITPIGGKVLDPFNGSGSTGCAAVELGCEYVGIELDAAYVEIATKRIAAWNKDDTSFKELFS